MPRSVVNIFLCCLALFIFFVGLAAFATVPASDARLVLQESRTSALDLEIAGELKGLPTGAVRYLSREELLQMPQVTALATDDANFDSATEISGASLELLKHTLSAHPQSDLVVAICKDKYRSYYSLEYTSAHDPILVLKINGEAPDAWPKDPTGQGLSIGPYLISHAKFTPSFKILSYTDVPQIPWGVIRLEFRNEARVLGAIAPSGPHAGDADVQAGYRIAEQNCFRCHNLGDEGGEKAGRTWLVLATWAAASPEYFSAYIRDPKSRNAKAQMPGFPRYDDATVQAVTSYFRTFSTQAKP